MRGKGDREKKRQDNTDLQISHKKGISVFIKGKSTTESIC
jgi:hypothetical protein